MTDHTPNRPGWDCARCGEPWPCAPAKRALAGDRGGSRTALTLSLADPFLAALADLRHLPPGDVYRRVVGWARTTAVA